MHVHHMVLRFPDACASTARAAAARMASCFYVTVWLLSGFAAACALWQLVNIDQMWQAGCSSTWLAVGHSCTPLQRVCACSSGVNPAVANPGLSFCHLAIMVWLCLQGCSSTCLCHSWAPAWPSLASLGRYAGDNCWLQKQLSTTCCDMI